MKDFDENGTENVVGETSDIAVAQNGGEIEAKICNQDGEEVGKLYY